MHAIMSAEVRAVQFSVFTALCHIEVFHDKMQLDIVVKPFINVLCVRSKTYVRLMI